MIIENPDVFKSWLTAILEPLCDADPAALAKYVYALVKKDKPVEELREVMVDQLDVFLQAETKPFVEMLFKSLEKNEHLQWLEAERPPTPPPEPKVEKAETEPDILATNGTALDNRAVSPSSNNNNNIAPRHRVVVTRALPKLAPRPPLEQTLVKVLPLTELLEEPVDQLPRRRDRRGEGAPREDRRRRRSRSADRRVRPRRHMRDNAVHDDGRRRASRSPSPRGRYRNRSPPPPPLNDRLSRSRSRSPVMMHRDSERDRDRLRAPRELERDRTSRDGEHRDRLSRSRDRDRSRERSGDRSRGSASPRPPPRGDHNDIYKRRCRDFDEKGYCMRGDQCQWDHGHDPVVLEDNALSRVLTMPPPVPEYNPLVPDIWMSAPPGFAPFPPPHLPPPRELIHIPRIHDGPPPGVLPPVMPPRLPLPHKNFDYNRLGKGPQRPPPPPPIHAVNCSLELKKVPRGMNDITHLNNHFSKFGKIVNIQICFGGDPEAALVTFSTPTEASVAYKSTEAVLNNRFIKVFWHNHDSKQENMAPGGLNQPKPLERIPGHPSHNKVLINRDNIKATADIKQNNIEKEKEKQANGQEAKKAEAPAAAPTPVDKSKRARELLDTQLHQQRKLIQKLESGNLTAQQKNVIMDAIKSTQQGIEKLQKELASYQGSITLKMQVKAKKPKTREEAQKEILDAELDMFTKQQEGQDVTDLMKRIDELRRNMAVQFPVHIPTIRRPHPSRGGGKYNPALKFTRSVGGATHKYPGSASVDHRPRALLISGFETDELESLYAHFSQYGEVSSKEVELSVPQLVLQYKARANAEQAMVHGRHYNDRTLTITWVSNQKPASSPPAVADKVSNGDVTADDRLEESSQSPSTDALLHFEEEEDEEREDRSWRR